MNIHIPAFTVTNVSVDAALRTKGVHTTVKLIFIPAERLFAQLSLLPFFLMFLFHVSSSPELKVLPSYK